MLNNCSKQFSKDLFPWLMNRKLYFFIFAKNQIHQQQDITYHPFNFGIGEFSRNLFGKKPLPKRNGGYVENGIRRGSSPSKMC